MSEMEGRPQSQPEPLLGAYLIGKKVSHYRVLELLVAGVWGWSIRQRI